jgi:hypothetical protein
MRRQANYCFLINIKRLRLRHRTEEVKTEKPEQQDPFPPPFRF